jgi:hypothetical protein
MSPKFNCISVRCAMTWTNKYPSSFRKCDQCTSNAAASSRGRFQLRRCSFVQKLRRKKCHDRPSRPVQSLPPSRANCTTHHALALVLGANQALAPAAFRAALVARRKLVTGGRCAGPADRLSNGVAIVWKCGALGAMSWGRDLALARRASEEGWVDLLQGMYSATGTSVGLAGQREVTNAVKFVSNGKGRKLLLHTGGVHGQGAMLRRTCDFLRKLRWRGE